ncbi:MAG: TIGR03000 domain-containing protein [Pirellulales bacterium]
MSGLSSSMPVEAYKTVEPSAAAGSGAEAVSPAEKPASEDSTAVPSDGAMLTVEVPADASIFVNGVKTKATGEVRRYISRGLVAGKQYQFTVRMSLEREGVETEESRVVSLGAGEGSHLSFSQFGENQSLANETAPTTTVTLHVPADAKVWLAGNATGSSGETRQFETTMLPAGRSWKDYEIRVVSVINGQQKAVSKIIDLNAGESVEFSIDPSLDLATLADATASLQ